MSRYIKFITSCNQPWRAIPVDLPPIGKKVIIAYRQDYSKALIDDSKTDNCPDGLMGYAIGIAAMYQEKLYTIQKDDKTLYVVDSHFGQRILYSNYTKLMKSLVGSRSQQSPEQNPYYMYIDNMYIDNIFDTCTESAVSDDEMLSQHWIQNPCYAVHNYWILDDNTLFINEDNTHQFIWTDEKIKQMLNSNLDIVMLNTADGNTLIQQDNEFKFKYDMPEFWMPLEKIF